MVVSFKDSFKLFGISIITCCAVCVCHLFLNYLIDLKAIESLVTTVEGKSLYDALVSTAIVCCCCAGGCLGITSMIMLFFYIKHYIDSHSKQIGILKALGYSDMRIASGFSIFGLSIFVGCIAGYLLGLALMPMYYGLQNDNTVIPQVEMDIHFVLFLLLVILPTIVFCLIAVFYSVFKLNQPTINLLKGIVKTKCTPKDHKEKKNFVSEMKTSVLKSRKTLVFFIGLSSFCFASMIQMSSSMDELASTMMMLMILIIGIVLAFTTLYIASTTVIRSNQKNIAMMRVFGYDNLDCKKAVLDGYRPAAYIGFAIGTIYQYGLLKIMVNVVFKDIAGTPEYNFNWLMFIITLAIFVIVYEGIMFIYGYMMKKIPLKQIMDE